MIAIRKKLVTDERHRPVAVQISYKDWQGIERRLGLTGHRPPRGLSSYSGRVALKEDPVEYQRRVREEWP